MHDSPHALRPVLSREERRERKSNCNIVFPGKCAEHLVKPASPEVERVFFGIVLKVVDKVKGRCFEECSRSCRAGAGNNQAGLLMQKVRGFVGHYPQEQRNFFFLGKCCQLCLSGLDCLLCFHTIGAAEGVPAKGLGQCNILFFVILRKAEVSVHGAR